MNKALVKSTNERMAAKLKARRDRALKAAARIDRLILMDASGSMEAVDALDMQGFPCSRFDALQEVWDRVVPLGEGRLGAFVFSDVAEPVKGAARGIVVRLPFHGGGTAMCDALARAVHFSHPGLRVLLVSDGLSTDGDPVGPAMLVGAPVDTVFVGAASGPEHDQGADALRRVAEATGGTFRDFAGGFDAARFLEHVTSVLQLKEG